LAVLLGLGLVVGVGDRAHSQSGSQSTLERTFPATGACPSTTYENTSSRLTMSRNFEDCDTAGWSAKVGWCLIRIDIEYRDPDAAGRKQLSFDGQVGGAVAHNNRFVRIAVMAEADRGQEPRQACGQDALPPGDPEPEAGTNPTSPGSGGSSSSSSASLSDGVVAPGQSVTISGSGFADGKELAMTFLSTPVPLGTTNSNANGAFRASVSIPRNATPGQHQLVVTGPGARGGTHRAIARLRVVGAGAASATPGELPRTGGNTGPLTVVGGLLLMLGWMLVRLSRVGQGYPPGQPVPFDCGGTISTEEVWPWL
jgi:LPXTG-motif cell wall-anchored protein